MQGLYWDANWKFFFLVDFFYFLLKTLYKGTMTALTWLAGYFSLSLVILPVITYHKLFLITHRMGHSEFWVRTSISTSSFVTHNSHISVAIGNFLQTLALYLLSFYFHRHMHTRICSWWHCLFIGWNYLLLITNLSLKINSFDVVGLFCVLPNSLLDLLIPNFRKINSIYHTRIIN